MSISATLAEVEQVFIQNELQQAKSVCVTADKPQSGTTAMTMALTERYLLAGFRTLLVDFNLFNPTFDSVTLPCDNQKAAQLIEHKRSQQLFLGLAAPLQRQEQLRYRDPASLSAQLNDWLNEYDRVVFDCTALSQCNQSNIPTVVVANAADTTLLILKAGDTTSEQMLGAISQIENANANVGGIILNQFQQPSWGESIARSLSKLPPLSRKHCQNLTDRLQKMAIFRYGV